MEVVADRPVLGVLRRDIQHDGARRALRLALVTERQPGELTDDPDTDAHRLVLDLRHPRVLPDRTARPERGGDERRRRLFSRQRNVDHSPPRSRAAQG